MDAVEPKQDLIRTNEEELAELAQLSNIRASAARQFGKNAEANEAMLRTVEKLQSNIDRQKASIDRLLQQRQALINLVQSFIDNTPEAADGRWTKELKKASGEL